MSRTTSARTIEVMPSARRLVTSLRDIGYDFTTAVADIVDNSVSAGADRIDVDIEFDGPRSRIVIADNGSGMSDRTLTEALRFGTRRGYADGDLGRYGLGLKTASLSQCRRLTVITKPAHDPARTYTRTLDLDHVEDVDRWEITRDVSPSGRLLANSRLADRSGTVVIWEQLDRLLPDKRPDTSLTARRFEQLAKRAGEYLGMVFHRFLEDSASRLIKITVNGGKVDPWNPFAPMERRTVELPGRIFELVDGETVAEVTLQSFVLPPKSRFSSAAAFERMSGPEKWNRQQGLYIYRADRLIQGGGWCGLRAIDEHTKLARAALDFPTALDSLFQVNVAKMRVLLPSQLRPQLERPLNELCQLAGSVYREDGPRAGNDGPRPRGRVGSDAAGVALRAAAMEVGDLDALRRIIAILRQRNPEIAEALGLG